MGAYYDSRPCSMEFAEDCSREDEAVCQLRSAADCPKRVLETSDAERERRRQAREACEMSEARRCRIPEHFFGVLGVAGISTLRETPAVLEQRRHRRGVLVLMGPTGTGKSVAAAAWAWDLRGAFWRAEEIQASDPFDRAGVAAVLNARALVVDDLGTEYDDAHGYWRTRLDALFARRFDADLPTVVTTNLTAASLHALVGDRVWRRVGEAGHLFACTERVFPDDAREPEQLAIGAGGPTG
ncbi:MAG: hypothetical protein JXB32_14465 [Deltaproteobacteria bacterium]|nr:hypothetical protein [Deltaproteobacteria bacterium]